MIDRQKAASKTQTAMTTPTLRRFAFSILCMLSVVLASVSRAEDGKIPQIKTASGKTYQDVRITKVTPSGISIIHESGVARIPLKDLPDDLKTKFGYDPSKAEAHAAAQAQANAQAEKQQAQAAKQQAEIKALMASAKPGIFIVDRYSGDKGLLVYGCTLDGLNAISGMRRAQKEVGKKHAPGHWNIVTTGQGNGESKWIEYDKKFLLIDLPKNENYVKNSAVGGMFVKAGTAKLEDDTRIPTFRFVGLGSSDDIGSDTCDR